jgi:hypothetical protein
MQHVRRSMATTEPRGVVQVRLEGPILLALENWRRSQPKIPPRSEALRAILLQALAEHMPAAA